MTFVFSDTRLLKLAYRPDFGAIVSAVVVLAAFTAVDPGGLWSFFTVKNITQYAAIMGLLALGQTFVIMTGEIDLSVGSVYGLTAIAFIIFANAVGVPLGFLAAMGVAALIGALNAILVVRLRLVSMVATMSTLFLFRGIIYLWTGGTADSLSRGNRTDGLAVLLGGNWLSLENGLFLFVLVSVLFQAFLSASRTGNHLAAVGGDVASAHSRGVKVGRTKTKAYLLSAMLAGFSGIVTICDQPQTHVTLGESLELESIAAAVLGGAALSGGRGSAIGPGLGALILTTVRYELIGLGAPSSWYITFIGLVLIVAVIANRRIATVVRRLA
jgi:simple sugar transport system permease protein